MFGVAFLLFMGTLTLTFNSSDKLSLGVSEAKAVDPVSCWVRTTSDCPNWPGGAGGGQRVTCDKSATPAAGEECTPVSCIWGTKKTKVCGSLDDEGEDEIE